MAVVKEAETEEDSAAETEAGLVVEKEGGLVATCWRVWTSWPKPMS